MKPDTKLPSPNMLIAALKRVQIRNCAVNRDYNDKNAAMYAIEKKVLAASPEYRKAVKESNAAYRKMKKQQDKLQSLIRDTKNLLYTEGTTPKVLKSMKVIIKMSQG